MSSGIGEQLVQALTGLTRGQRHRGSRFDMLRSILGREGSETKAARSIGIARATLHNILTGRTRNPKTSTIDRITGAFRTGQIKHPLPSDSAITLKCYDNRDPGRERTLSGERLLLADGTVQRAAEAWVRTGSTEAVAAAFIRGIGDEWYATWLTPAEGEWENVGADDPSEVDDWGDLPDPEDYPDDWDLIHDLWAEAVDDLPGLDYGATVTAAG